MSWTKTIAHMPARSGSQRVPKKNLRIIAGKPMLQYAVEATLGVPNIDEIYVNTDDEEMAALGKQLGSLVYHRNSKLASNTASSDEFNEDIITALQPKTLIMVSPTCPLITSEDVELALTVYNKADVDTLITCSETRMQTFCDGEPVNIDVNAPLAPSQDNSLIKVLNWAITIWDGPSFLKRMNAVGYAVWGKKRLLHTIPTNHGIKVSTESDIRMAEALIRARASFSDGSDPMLWSSGTRTE
jgi:CMP-N,N'-diacetyllegionaminic acid synthase